MEDGVHTVTSSDEHWVILVVFYIRHALCFIYESGRPLKIYLVVVATTNHLFDGGSKQNGLFPPLVHILLEESTGLTCSNWAVYVPGFSFRGG